jgi:RNA polymerase sigma-70 factor, ECF subfamily
MECGGRRSILGVPAVAEDLRRDFFKSADTLPVSVTQRTFSKIWAALGSYEGRSSFSTWIHGIGRHVYLDWRRSGNRLDPQSDEWWETCADDSPSPFETTAERDEAARLYALVASLDEAKRDVIHLHYYQGLTLKETAEVLTSPRAR